MTAINFRNLRGGLRHLAGAPRPLIIAILIGTALRIALIWDGQYFFPDENRYNRCLHFWEAVAEMEPAGAVTMLFRAQGRPGAILTYLPVALVQWTANRVLDAAPIQTSWIPALFTVVLAGVNVILIYRLAKSLWNDRLTSTLPAVLYAFAAPSLYYARFLLPYLAAHTYLLAAALALPRGPHHAGRRCVLAGLLFGLAFATYPGVYDQVLTLTAIAAALRPGRGTRRIVDLAWFGAGVALILSGLHLLSWAGWGPTYFSSLLELRRHVIQGDFGEVWSYPIAFLAASDPTFGVMLLIGMAGIAWGLLSGRRDARVLWLCAAVLFWYGWRLADACTQRQVLYGRLVFQLLPALCLLGGVGLSGLFRRTLATPQRLTVLTLLVALSATWNLRPFFQAASPAHFEWRFLQSADRYDVVGFVTSIEGTSRMRGDNRELENKLARVASPHSAADPIVLANVAFLHPVCGFRQPKLRGSQVIARAWHPLNIAALQFDAALDRRERALLREHVVWMMSIRVPAAAPQGWFERWADHKLRGAHVTAGR